MKVGCDETCIVTERREDADFIAHARTALPDLAKAWLAVQEALEEYNEDHVAFRGQPSSAVADIRAAILRG